MKAIVPGRGRKYLMWPATSGPIAMTVIAIEGEDYTLFCDDGSVIRCAKRDFMPHPTPTTRPMLLVLEEIRHYQTVELKIGGPNVDECLVEMFGDEIPHAAIVNAPDAFKKGPITDERSGLKILLEVAEQDENWERCIELRDRIDAFETTCP